VPFYSFTIYSLLDGKKVRLSSVAASAISLMEKRRNIVPHPSVCVSAPAIPPI